MIQICRYDIKNIIEFNRLTVSSGRLIYISTYLEMDIRSAKNKDKDK